MKGWCVVKLYLLTVILAVLSSMVSVTYTPTGVRTNAPRADTFRNSAMPMMQQVRKVQVVV